MITYCHYLSFVGTGFRGVNEGVAMVSRVPYPVLEASLDADIKRLRRSGTT
jgi:hypothetical protein